MTVRELRSKYIRFFESKDHLLYPSGSLIPFDVTGRLDESLLFNGAGMIQFKPYFRGVAQPETKRLTTCQKCVRTGDIDIVGDATHLTFFEMLGNFSFGDYFKSEAIAYSWEFLTSSEWLGLDPKKLSFTIFEDDDDAFTEWSKWLTTAAISPEERVIRLGEDTNYWPASSFSNGPPGPCGPNSEMFYWVAESPPPGPGYTREDWIADDAAGNWVEIWNDVFIRYEWQGTLRNPARPADGYVKEGMPDLPFRSIDTGMGLDRTAMVLGSFETVYDTDSFAPIFRVIDELTPSRSETGFGEVEPAAVLHARRVIADHIRTSVFCIADGILPSNNGRGYVLRRLIRRAVLKGVRTLGFTEAFFHRVYDGVVESMGDFYVELIDRREVIVETLKNEEALFRRTLENGLKMLEEQLHARRGESLIFAGDSAFQLYDTFGFPLEVTQEICNEHGVTVDVAGFEAAMLEAQERSRGAQDRESVYGGVGGLDDLVSPDAPESTHFTGYNRTDGPARIVRVRHSGSKVFVALDQTPFYAESGGQTGDQGTIEGIDFTLRVLNTTKSQGIFWHEVAFTEPSIDDLPHREESIDLSAKADEKEPQPLSQTERGANLLGISVQATVSNGRRHRIIRNHTATHLLQAALRTVLGIHVTQAGSYVGPENLRFDFTHGKALSPEEIGQIERMVNEQVLQNTSVEIHVDLPISEAKARGAMALFGEKYGNLVRMVEIGSFSKELCGGIHVRSTGEVGLFKIVSESSAASGVRRIEALTGEAAYDWVVDQTKRITEAAHLLKAHPRDLLPAVERALDTIKDERKKRERAEMAMAKGAGNSNAQTQTIGETVLHTQLFEDLDPKMVAAWVDDVIAHDDHAVALAALVADGKVTFTCKVGKAAKANAGNLVREVAKVAGGGGGGRPDFATAGGKDPSKATEAMAVAAFFVG